jgi:hypothetical protein
MTGPRDRFRPEKRRIAVPDTAQPGFAEEAHRQGALLRGRQEETEALAFIGTAVNQPDP